MIIPIFAEENVVIEYDEIKNTPFMYKNSEGYSIVNGTIHNIGTYDVTNVAIIVYFYGDFDLNVLEVKIGYPLLKDIPIGSSSSFSIRSETPNPHITYAVLSIQDSDKSVTIPPHITITTDKPSYTAGETIHISGEFNNLQNGTSLNISLQSPEGNYSAISNITTNNNTYSKSFNTQYDSSISTPGSYTLTAHYGTDTTTTTFDYSSTPTQQDNEYFIPDSSYIILSDHEIEKWNRELTKWQNAQNRTDSKIEFYYEKLDTAMIRNQTDKIETYTERIGHSMALSSLYDGIIQCLEEQIELFS